MFKFSTKPDVPPVAPSDVARSVRSLRYSTEVFVYLYLPVDTLVMTIPFVSLSGSLLWFKL